MIEIGVRRISGMPFLSSKIHYIETQKNGVCRQIVAELATRPVACQSASCLEPRVVVTRYPPPVCHTGGRARKLLGYPHIMVCAVIKCCQILAETYLTSSIPKLFSRAEGRSRKYGLRPTWSASSPKPKRYKRTSSSRSVSIPHLLYPCHDLICAIAQVPLWARK